jgi:hypothetical protein
MSGRMVRRKRRAAGQSCPYCKRQMVKNDSQLHPTADHIHPQSLGGQDTVIACLQCNGIKADMLPEDWIIFMAKHPSWWLMSKYEMRLAKRSAWKDQTAGMPGCIDP